MLPRRALNPILHTLRPAMGELAERIDAELAACSAGDIGTVGLLGTAVWTEAARLAPGLQAPADPALPEADFRALTSLCTRVWTHGPALWELLSHAPAHPPAEALGRAFSAAAVDPEVVSVMIATLLHRAAAPGTLARATCQAAPEVASLAEEALDRWIAGSVPDSILVTPEAATDAAAWFDAVTEDLEAAGWLVMSARRNRIAVLRQRIERACEPGPEFSFCPAPSPPFPLGPEPCPGTFEVGGGGVVLGWLVGGGGVELGVGSVVVGVGVLGVVVPVGGVSLVVVGVGGGVSALGVR